MCMCVCVCVCVCALLQVCVCALGWVKYREHISLLVILRIIVDGLMKNHSYFMQAVCTLLWTDCFETYMVVT